MEIEKEEKLLENLEVDNISLEEYKKAIKVYNRYKNEYMSVKLDKSRKYIPRKLNQNETNIIEVNAWYKYIDYYKYTIGTTIIAQKKGWDKKIIIIGNFCKYCRNPTNTSDDYCIDCYHDITGQNYRAGIGSYNGKYNKCENCCNLFRFIEIDDKYCNKCILSDENILFLLPKKERIKILCNDIIEDFREEKRQRKLEKIKFEAKIKAFKKVNKYKLIKELKKPKDKELLTKTKLLEREFLYLYNNNLTICKYQNCKEKCANDVGYCLNHYPDVCSECDWVCNPDNKYDKLTTNKLYDMDEICQKCTKKKFLEYYRNNYNKDKLFRYVKDENSMDSILSQMKYQEFINSSNTYTKLKELKEEQKMSDIDFKKYLCSESVLTDFLDIPKDKIEENLSFKWQLYRQLIRTDDLVKTFGDNLKYIKFSNIRFRRMGYIQFQAFKNHLYELIYGKPYIEIEHSYNNIFNDIEEPDTSITTDEIYV